jgi:MerR family copper efflux transcriptional regulator
MKKKEQALDEMCRSLEHLAGACHGNERPDCPILGNLASNSEVPAKGPRRRL